MRHDPTDAERTLWRLLRGRRFDGFKFRRQMPIGPFIADFVCLEKRLIIELDGGQHAESKADARRDAWLLSQGFRVLRLWNTELIDNRQGVLDTIWNALQPAPGADQP